MQKQTSRLLVKMNNWIWVGIVIVVLFFAWLKLRSNKEDSYSTTRSDGLWGRVKDACCIRSR